MQSHHWLWLGWGGIVGTPVAGRCCCPWSTAWRRGWCGHRGSLREPPTQHHTHHHHLEPKKGVMQCIDDEYTCKRQTSTIHELTYCIFKQYNIYSSMHYWHSYTSCIVTLFKIGIPQMFIPYILTSSNWSLCVCPKKCPTIVLLKFFVILR